MRELRPALLSEAAFVERVNGLQRPQGYRLVACFAEGDPDPAAVAGFRTAQTLAWGHILYCDDLSTRPDQRRKGYAGMLIEWLLDEARRLGCDQFHLDSGVQAERKDAHRLYFNKGMRISAYHFDRSL